MIIASFEYLYRGRAGTSAAIGSSLTASSISYLIRQSSSEVWRFRRSMRFFEANSDGMVTSSSITRITRLAPVSISWVGRLGAPTGSICAARGTGANAGAGNRATPARSRPCVFMIRLTAAERWITIPDAHPETIPLFELEDRLDGLCSPSHRHNALRSPPHASAQPMGFLGSQPFPSDCRLDAMDGAPRQGVIEATYTLAGTAVAFIAKPLPNR
jgi:hypothetical protein